MIIEQELRDMIQSFVHETSVNPEGGEIVLTWEAKERLIVELAALIEVKKKEALKGVVRDIYQGVVDSIDQGTL